jgi:hypothetical protein
VDFACNEPLLFALLLWHWQLTSKRTQVAVAASKIERQVRALVGRVPSPGDVKDAIQNALNMRYAVSVLFLCP